MGGQALAQVKRLVCMLRGHEWAGHSYQEDNSDDVQMCTRCGDTRQKVFRHDAT